MRVGSLFALVLVGLSACASGPEEGLVVRGGEEVWTRVEGGAPMAEVRYIRDRELVVRSVDASPEEVWAALPAVYAELEIPLTVRDPATRTLGNGGFRPRRIAGKRRSTFVDCGYGITATPYADQYQVTMSVVTRVRVGEDGATVVETELTGTAKPRDVSGGVLTCNTKGVLERTILERLRERLAGGDGGR